MPLAELETCAGLATAEQKLACFEGLVAGEQETPATKAPVEPVSALDESAPATLEAVAEAATVEPEPAATAATSAVAEAPLANAPGLVAAEVVDEPVEAAPTVAVVSNGGAATDSADSFGREHLENGKTESLQARVTQVTKERLGALVFHLDNGQIWRQMEPRYFPYPRSAEFDVLITTGMMGEYRLQVGGSGRKVKIKRVK